MIRSKGSIARHLDSVPVRANDPIGIQQYREMLGGAEARLEYGNGNLGLTRDVLEQGEHLADGHFTGVRLSGVVRPTEQDADEIWYGRVLAENAIDGRVARRALDGS